MLPTIAFLIAAAAAFAIPRRREPLGAQAAGRPGLAPVRDVAQSI